MWSAASRAGPGAGPGELFSLPSALGYAAAGGAAAALEALGGDAAAWARYEAAVVSASGGASVKVLRTGAMLGGPYYALDVDTLRAQTARVVDDERAVAVRAPSPKRSQPVCKSNLQPDFNVSVCDRFDAASSAVLRELDESNRFVQKSAESTSI